MDQRVTATPDMIITLVGNSGVGKSQILDRLTYNSFCDDSVKTMGIDCVGKKITLEGGSECSIRFWDMAGEKRFAPLSIPLEVRNSDGAVVVVLDGTAAEKQLHASMTEWVDWAEENSPNATIYFMVNKMDAKDFRLVLNLQREILEWNSDRKQLNENHQNIGAFYCSAKTGDSTLHNRIITQETDGIQKAFSSIATDCSVKRANALQTAGSSGKRKNTGLSTSGASRTSEDGSAWEDFKDFLSDNAVWAGINVFLIIALITLLLVAAFPVGAVFALGPLSALTVVGIIGNVALLLWNVGYAIFKGLGGGEPPSATLDGLKSTIGSSVVTGNSQAGPPGHQPGPLSQPGTEKQIEATQKSSSGAQTSSKSPSYGSTNRHR